VTDLLLITIELNTSRDQYPQIHSKLEANLHPGNSTAVGSAMIQFPSHLGPQS
jgi:hypothetical protein